jgi:hypothetical protein
LRAFRAALILVAVLLGITATIVLQGIHSTAQTVRHTAAPAYLQLVEARAVLFDADRAVWQSLRSGETQFTGPGQNYEADITLADQDLQQVAALQPPGNARSKALQTLTGQLVTYQGLVEQADAANREDTALPASSHDLGIAALGYAGQALDDGQGGGLLPTMSKLSDLSQQALNGRLTSFWAGRELFAVFAAAGVVVLGLIIAFQLFLRRRFRRTVSAPLLLSAALVCGLLAWMGAVILPADTAFARARNAALPQLVNTWQNQIQAVDTRAHILKTSAVENGGDTVGRLDLTAVRPLSDTFDAELASAQNTGGLPVGAPIGAVVIALLAVVAAKPRLDEYRG